MRCHNDVHRLRGETILGPQGSSVSLWPPPSFILGMRGPLRGERQRGRVGVARLSDRDKPQMSCLKMTAGSTRMHRVPGTLGEE
jgi:hypothetical protein